MLNDFLILMKSEMVITIIIFLLLFIKIGRGMKNESMLLLIQTLLLLNVIAGFIFKKVTPLHQQVSKIADELGVLADSIKVIENEKFSSPLLQQLQAQFVQQNSNASEQLKELQKIDWTGNIRELRNVVERLVILSDKKITEKDVIQFASKK